MTSGDAVRSQCETHEFQFVNKQIDNENIV